MSLFPLDLDKLGYSILNDNELEFCKNYRSQTIIDNLPLLLFCIESSAFNITKKIILDYKIEFKKLSTINKVKFFKILLSKNINNEYTENAQELIYIILNNYKLNKEIQKDLFILILQFSSKNMIKYYQQIFDIKLLLKNINTLLIYIKPITEGTIKNNILNQIINYVEKNKNSHNLWSLLTNSLGNDLQESVEIKIFENLSINKKQEWYNYLLKNDNLIYHTHNVGFFNKSNFNNEDLNLDFLFFLNYYILSIDINYKDIEKLNKYRDYLKHYLNTLPIRLSYFIEPLKENILILEKVLLKNKLSLNIHQNIKVKKGKI